MGHRATLPLVTTPEPERAPSIPVEDRPLDLTPVRTADLPATPQRDQAIAVSAWVEAPSSLVGLADAIGATPARYLRRIGPWLLWRAGPPRGAASAYWAARADELAIQFTFSLSADGSGDGVGPSGERHTRFRAWKEDLRDHG